MLVEATTFFRANPSATAFDTLTKVMLAFQAWHTSDGDAGIHLIVAEKALNRLRNTKEAAT